MAWILSHFQSLILQFHWVSTINVSQISNFPITIIAFKSPLFLLCIAKTFSWCQWPNFLLSIHHIITHDWYKNVASKIEINKQASKAYLMPSCEPKTKVQIYLHVVKTWSNYYLLLQPYLLLCLFWNFITYHELIPLLLMFSLYSKSFAWIVSFRSFLCNAYSFANRFMFIFQVFVFLILYRLCFLYLSSFPLNSMGNSSIQTPFITL